MGEVHCFQRINPVAKNLLPLIGNEWGVPICSQVHKKETPHDTANNLNTTTQKFLENEKWGVPICSRAHKKETPHDGHVTNTCG